MNYGLRITQEPESFKVLSEFEYMDGYYHFRIISSVYSAGLSKKVRRYELQLKEEDGSFITAVWKPCHGATNSTKMEMIKRGLLNSFFED